MKETYYVGFDPKNKLWEAQAISHDFESNYWVFRVTARNEIDALSKGLVKCITMTREASPDEMKLINHIKRQVNLHGRKASEVVMISIPTGLDKAASSLESKGMLSRAYNDEIILDRESTGWKCMRDFHLSKPAIKSKLRPEEIGSLAFA